MSSSSSWSSSIPITTPSRKGGTPHQLSEWHTSPPCTDPTLPSPDRISHRRLQISTWSITSSRGAIGNSQYMDSLSEQLTIPPPEMVFPANTLVIRHVPSGWEYRFDAESALRCVDGVKEEWKKDGMDLSVEWRAGTSSGSGSGSGDGGSGGMGAGRKNGSGTTSAFGEKPAMKKKTKGIKVAYADEWGKSREPSSTSSSSTSPSPASSTPPTTAFGAAASTQIADARDYDWTYSTTWAGEAGRDERSGTSDQQKEEALTDESSSGSSGKVPAFTPGTDPSIDRIPVERLGPSSGEPILFYDDLVLFEDELGDNGSSMLGVKVRVMPSGFLILQRFLLRVDDVVFRLFDTRMYCAFNEQQQQEIPSSAFPSSGNDTTIIPAAAPWASTGRPTTVPPQAAANPRLPSLGGLSLGQPRRAGSSTVESSRAAVLGDLTHMGSSSKAQQRLIRECNGCEAPYKDVKARLPAYRPNDLSLLTDTNWVANALQNLSARQFAAFQSSNKSSIKGGVSSSLPVTNLSGKGGSLSASSPSSSSSQQPQQAQRQRPQANTLLAQTLAPARLPLTSPSSLVGGGGGDAGQEGMLSNAILGEVDAGGCEDSEGEVWQGVGGRVDVVIF